MRTTGTPTTTLGMMVAASLLMSLVGCANDSFVSPQQADISGSFAPSNVGPIHILSMDPNKQPPAALSKGETEEAIVRAEEFIRADHGGKLEVGEGRTGKSKVEFKKDDLPRDLTVLFEWADGSTYSGVIDAEEDGLEDVVFNNPVKVEVTYKWADFMDLDEDAIGLYMYGEATAQWEKISGEVNQGSKEVKATISRFGQIALLQQKDGDLIDVFKRDADVYFTRKLIKAKKGGKLEVGNAESGKSKIEFKKHDLPEDLRIAFEWAADGTFQGALTDMKFGPHGTFFNHPVKVELSYKLADLSGIEEGELKIFYFNGDTGQWELIGGEVDIKKKKVTVYLNHFSRYALARSR